MGYEEEIEKLKLKYPDLSKERIQLMYTFNSQLINNYIKNPNYSNDLVFNIIILIKRTQKSEFEKLLNKYNICWKRKQIEQQINLLIMEN